jgi:transposase InsO family protein
VENYILNVKHEHTSWGARKIRERLARSFPAVKLPAKSTIHAVLDRHGLVERRGRSRRHAQGTALSLGQHPNELWCTDYKGEFLLGNRRYCYPLTVTDHASRYLLTCGALSSTREDPCARTARQPIRPQVVTYVAGTFCNLCLRAGPRILGAGERFRTVDLVLGKHTLYQLSYTRSH